MLYTNGTLAGQLYATDGTLSITEGSGNTYPFADIFSPRVWNGTLHYTVGPDDCNLNGVPDAQDIANGFSRDCNANGVPDECEPDCNGNWLADACEITAGTSQDCNGNGIPDACDLASGHSTDLNGDGVPDDCYQPTLYANVSELSLSAGGIQSYQMKTPPLPGLHNVYLLLGSASGTSPGTQVGAFQIPLNLDAYTLHTFNYPNQPPFIGSMGALIILPTTFGFGSSYIDLPPGFAPPGLVGLTLNHAYVVLDTQTGNMVFVTNAVPLTLLP